MVSLDNLFHKLFFPSFPNLHSLYKTLDANRCKLLCHTNPHGNAMQTPPNQLCTEQPRCGSCITMFTKCCTKANKPYRAAELIISVAGLDKHNYITSGFKLLHMHATVWHRWDLQAGETAYRLLVEDLCMSSIWWFSRAFLLQSKNPKSVFILTQSAFYHTHQNSPRPDK